MSITITLIKADNNQVEIYPGTNNVDWLFDILFIKCGYSEPGGLFDGTESDESGLDYLKVQLNYGQTVEQLLLDLKRELLPVITEIEPTPEGYYLHLTTPNL